MQPLSDAELIAFLDGQVSHARSVALTQAICINPVFEARVMAVDPVAKPVQIAFQSVGPVTPSAALLPPRPHAFKDTSWRPMWIAASVVGVALVGTFSWMNRTPATPAWMHQVAAYQALYSPETIASIPHVASDTAAQLRRAGTTLGLELPSAALADLAGLDLWRAQILSYKGQPLTQIVFADAGGKPIALCIFKTAKAVSDDVQLVRMQGLESAHFSAAGFSFLVIGPTDSAAIAGFASDVQDIFARG